MATKEIELEVDFIGEQVSLTIEEEKAITAFLNNKRLSIKHIPTAKGPKPTRKSKTTA